MNSFKTEEPWAVEDDQECVFYHTIDLPEYGLKKGQWDLRNKLDSYLAPMDLFKDKKVIDFGAANGFISFELEKFAAEVLSFDIHLDIPWDIVPFDGQTKELIPEQKEDVRQIRRAYWLTHRLLESKVNAFYGHIYNLPLDMPKADIAVVGSILLHLRDPFLALQNIASKTKERIIVAEPIWYPKQRWMQKLAHRYLGPACYFLPNPKNKMPIDTWWQFPPETMERYLGVLGFEVESMTESIQIFEPNRPISYYTMVGKRKSELSS